MKLDERMPTTEGQGAIDRILANEEALIPSSGFLCAVMERVRDEEVTPKPIAFPWKRVLPGMIVVAMMLAGGGFELLRWVLPATGETTLTARQFSAGIMRALVQAGWIAVALGAPLFSWILAKRLTGRSGLI